MADANDKKDAKLTIEWRHTISRLFIFRFLWVYILIFPLIPLGIWLGIVTFLHFWYMLFMGKRHQGFWNTQVRFYQFMARWQCYLGNLSDKTPSLWW